MNNRKVPLWNKDSFKRLHSPRLNLWLPFIFVWLVVILCCLLYFQASKRTIIGASSVTPIEFAIVFDGIFILITLLSIPYLSETICVVMCPLPVSASGRSTDHDLWSSPNNLDYLSYVCMTANNESGQGDESNCMPTTTEQNQVNLVDPSEKDELSPPQKREGLDQALTIINQIGQTLTTSLHLVDIASICRAVLCSAQFKELFLFDLAIIKDS